MSKDWIQSFSGKEVTPAALKVEQVSFDDIGHALAQKIRFTGHLREMGYSVAQHCVLGAEQITPGFELAFLLHEVSEVYLPDIAAPIKPMLKVHREDGSVHSWAEVETHHANVVFEALGLSPLRPLIDSPEVHDMDLRMLMTEKRDLMGPGSGRAWSINHAPLDIRIARCWPPEEAKGRFNTLYHYLMRERR